MIGRIDAGHEIDQRGLAGTVGTDQAADLARVDAQVTLVGGLQGAEALAQADG